MLSTTTTVALRNTLPVNVTLLPESTPRAISINGTTAVTPPPSQVVVGATHYLTLGAKDLAEVRGVYDRGTGKLAALSDSILGHPSFLTCIDVVITDDASHLEAFLRASIADAKPTLPTRHDVAHLWKLSQPTLAAIKARLVAGEYSEAAWDADSDELTQLEKYFELVPSKPCVDAKTLDGLEADANWRIHVTIVGGAATKGFHTSADFSRLRPMTNGLSKVEKRKLVSDDLEKKLTDAQKIAKHFYSVDVVGDTVTVVVLEKNRYQVDKMTTHETHDGRLAIMLPHCAV